MRILQINTVAYGSTGRIMHQIADRCRQEGDEVMCCVPTSARNRRAKKEYDRLFGNRALRMVSEVFEYATGLHSISYPLTTRALLKEMVAFRPDIVHLHNIHGRFVNWKMLFSYIREKDIALVWTLHDCWPFTGHCPHFEMIGCNRWQSECHHCRLFRQYPYSLVDDSRWSYRQKKNIFNSVENAMLVPVSIWLGNLLKKSFLKEIPVQIIHNGIDMETFRPREQEAALLRQRYGLKDKKVLLGVAMPWSERKGIKDFFELRTMLGDEYAIVLVGVDKKQKQRLPNGIIGVGRTSSQCELAAWYTAADIVLNLSVEESFGLTSVEGYACGTPTIVYNATASPELVDGSCGVCVEKKDVLGVKQAIEQLLSKDQEKLSSLCRQYAKQHFDSRKTYDAYIKLYDRVFNMNIKAKHNN